MKRLLTTPIYYVNDVPHIGHAYSTIIADVIKKYWTLQGDDVFLLTGTDEHGQKIEEAARKKGIKTIEYANTIANKFRDVWDKFHIDYNKFIRTTYLEHILSVQKAFEIMFDKGDIYKGEYEGQYCVSCESFFTQTQVLDGIYCPDCGKETRLVKEESYFFRLSKYQNKLLEWYKNNPACILPLHKKNEVIKFVDNSLQDLSITRTSFEWGIKVPLKLKDDKHIVYVWLDALMNYPSALGYGLDYNNARELLQHKAEQNPALESKMEYFKHTSHVVGKDILRFHAIYWPAFLMSLELPLPEHIFVHGWWTIDGVKMSKSIGNVINPLDILEAYPLDIFRYFLLKEVPFGQDGDFSERALINRNNGELSNDLGNLVNRLIGMSEKYFEYDLSDSFSIDRFQLEREKVDELSHEALGFMNNMQPNKYLESIWEMLHLANAMITKFAPWEMMKRGEVQECKELLNLIANILLKVSLLLYPIMPTTCLKIAACLGVKIDSVGFRGFIVEFEYKRDFKITKIDALFPKIDSPRMKKDSNVIASESEAIESKGNSPTLAGNATSLPPHLAGDTTLSSPPLAGGARGGVKSHAPDSKDSQKSNIESKNIESKITLSDFQKIHLKVGTILSAEKLEKSEKLLKLKVDLGEENPRQIIAGISQFYNPESLVNSQVIVLANLKPAKLMGELSEGMLLACKDSNGLSLLRPENPRHPGTPIS
ncbi:methionine--tRNA ligase [Helicobacter saguini]|uniref:Methionine--tRNA ligase n=1 Tax=Helicobacter saguini TaxID=1548018 RepID=A0A099B9J4_9HELI|nr:methionine--tRNA ligase [Helicobacter saguini]MWV63104.1 methionine--tRNA ligase [Helicobacter saguini]MWV66226.1 methionine--tRNA ligase [Helicobacter saguini]MWV68577.1 methionine--tRNA ligase [Helicobacter saguini]MWV71870.1 methionine--tRNA ligase [Helicobacter saguini]TLD95886.1 methionine--tRNA ligase [Helicobacter saguini]